MFTLIAIASFFDKVIISVFAPLCFRMRIICTRCAGSVLSLNKCVGVSFTYKILLIVLRFTPGGIARRCKSIKRSDVCNRYKEII